MMFHQKISAAVHRKEYGQRMSESSCLFDEKVGSITAVDQQQKCAFQTVDFPSAAHDREERNGQKQHRSEVDQIDLRSMDRTDQRRDPQDAENVEDI